MTLFGALTAPLHRKPMKKELSLGDIVMVKGRNLPPMRVLEIGTLPRSLNSSERFVIILSKDGLESYSAQARKFRHATEAEVKKFKKLRGSA